MLGGIAREVMLMCWKVIDEDAVADGRGVGGRATASAPRACSVTSRWPPRTATCELRDIFYGDIGLATLGEPQRAPGR